MEGYAMMADGYRKLTEQGKITEEIAAPEIRVFDFLAECSKEDVYRLFNSAVFNDIVSAYVKAACKEAELTEDKTAAVCESLRWLLDTRTAEDISKRF